MPAIGGGALTVSYRVWPQGQPRPYLVLIVTGINGQSGPVMGLLDSGADTTSFPMGYAHLMGYTAAMLEVQQIGQVAGTVNAFKAMQPCTAVVPEMPHISVPIKPLFVPGAQMVLWGRCDFMAAFDVILQEKSQTFTIRQA